MGIGVTTPAYKLDVGGDINFTGFLRVNGDYGTQGYVLTSNGPYGAAYWSNAGIGPQGPQGPAGADGAQGPQGNNGSNGNDGAQGANGNNGMDGKYTSVQGPLYEVSYNQIGIYQAGSASDGYLSSTDWNTFNNKGSSVYTFDGSGNLYSTNGGYSGGGSYNFISGYQAGGSNYNSGSSNIFLGLYSGYYNSSGYNNILLGSNSGYNNSTGSGNLFAGNNAGYNNTTGVGNTFLGDTAGYSNYDGGSNTIIGYNANVGSGSLTNATAIGYGAVVNNSNSMVLGNGVYVGINNSSPSYQLDVSGEIHSNSDICTDSYCMNSLSDSRLKTDIMYLASSTNASTTLEKILTLNPISYKWNDIYLNSHKGLIDATTTKLGFIAQDMNVVFPEVVTHNSDGFLGIDYSRLTAVLTQGLKDVYVIVVDLKNKVGSMFTWFGGDGSKFTVQGDVCVDGTCITKDEFKQMLINAKGNSPVAPSTPSIGSPDSSNSGDSSSTTASTTIPTDTGSNTTGSTTLNDQGNGSSTSSNSSPNTESTQSSTDTVTISPAN